MEREEKELARRVVRTYLERKAPDQLEDLDIAFDAVYRSVSHRLATLGDPEVESGEPRLPFGPEIADASLVLFATTITVLYLRQRAGLVESSRLLGSIEVRLAAHEEELKTLRNLIEESSPSEPDGLAPANSVPTPAQTLPPADLEIRVTTRGEGDALVLDYVLHSPNGHFELTYASFPGGYLRHPDTCQQRIFRTLEKLHHGLDSRDARLTATDVATELTALGEDLSDELFPSELQRTLLGVREAETVLLVSDEPWIPWEIVKPYEAQGGDDGFLASRQLARWLPGGRTPAARIGVGHLAVVEAGSPPDLKELTKAIDELRFLGELAARHGIDDRSLAEADYPGVLALLAEHDLDLIHFVGHGEHDAEDPETSGFHLHDGRTLRPRDLRKSLQRRMERNRPLVFLNSCQMGRQGWSLTRPGGWARRFLLGAGCGAFVAPQWTVGDEAAHAFAVAFYEALERGKTFGEATLAARGALPAGSPGRFAYAVYAHPGARLAFPDTIADGPSSPVPTSA